jgi:sigma-B regulation protein RsbU (phosphoserine phosphatase)
MFVTFFLAILNVSTGTLEYCNAGHNPPYLIRDGKPTQLEQFHGYPLGIRSTNYKYARTHIHKGDTLVLYTDGVTEAENKERELFDEHTLEKVLTQCAGNSPHSIVNSILKEITLYADGFEQSDDIALLALQYNGAAELTYEKPAFFKYSIQVKQNIDDLIILKTELDSLFAAWKINKEVIDDYQLVMEELMTNIIYYAFNDDEEHFINIKINFEDNKLTTQIEDNGIEFNPLDAEDPSIPTSIRGVKPGGLGIFLCKQILDKITYERVDEKNVLTFSKINK